MKTPEIELRIDEADDYKFIIIYCAEQTLNAAIDWNYVKSMGVSFNIFINYILVTNDDLQTAEHWSFLVEYLSKALNTNIQSVKTLY